MNDLKKEYSFGGAYLKLRMAFIRMMVYGINSPESIHACHFLIHTYIVRMGIVPTCINA